VTDELHEARRRRVAELREKLAHEMRELVHDAEHWNRTHPNEEPIIIDPNLGPDVERRLAELASEDPDGNGSGA